MKISGFAAITLLIIATAVLSGGCASQPKKSAQPVNDMTSQAAAQLIQENAANPNFVILDVRTPAEYTAGHIEKAVNIDYEAANFESEIDKLDRAKKYMVYYRTGNRSRSAVNIMKDMGFQDINHLYNGIAEWIAAGYATVK
jgi:rhodanese-related sulfurtransferase